MRSIYNSGIEVPCIILHMEEDEEEFGYGAEPQDNWIVMTFLTISSYGASSYNEHRNGTLFVSDGIEYFTNVDKDNFEKALAQSKYNEMMNQMLIYSRN